MLKNTDAVEQRRQQKQRYSSASTVHPPPRGSHQSPTVNRSGESRSTEQALNGPTSVQQPSHSSAHLSPSSTCELDGWTQVSTKGRRRRNFAETNTAFGSSIKNPIAVAKLRNPPSRSIPLSAIQADFDVKNKIWQASRCREIVWNTLKYFRTISHCTITKALCLGIGSFARDNAECRKRSMWQFVVFVDLVQFLRQHGDGGAGMAMLAQEPMLTDADVEFLSSVGVTILPVTVATAGSDDVEGGLGLAAKHLGSETFVYEPFLDMTESMARQIVNANLGLYVGSSMRGLLGRTGPATELAKRFDEHYAKYWFPKFVEDPNVLEGLGIYWEEIRDKETGSTS